MTCKALGFFTLECRFEFVKVQGVKEKQGGCKVVVFGWQSTDEGHAEEFLVKVIESEGGWAQSFDILHGFVSSGHEGREGLALFFADVEEDVVGIKASTWFLLEMNSLKLPPHLCRVRLDLLDMDLFVKVAGMPGTHG